MSLAGSEVKVKRVSDLRSPKTACHKEYLWTSLSAMSVCKNIKAWLKMKKEQQDRQKQMDRLKKMNAPLIDWSWGIKNIEHL